MTYNVFSGTLNPTQSIDQPGVDMLSIYYVTVTNVSAVVEFNVVSYRPNV